MSLINESLRKRLFSFFLLEILIAFLLGQLMLTNIGIAGLIILWATDESSRKRIKDVLSSVEFWLISSLFWFTLIGLIYTEVDNLSDGLKYVERRLGLLIFPLIILSSNFSENTISLIKKVLFWAIPIIGISGFINSYINYSTTGNLSLFYNNNLLKLFDHQAVYFSLLINIILFFLLPELTNVKKFGKGILVGLFLVFCLVFQFYLASRLSLVISIVITGFIIYTFTRRIIGKKSIVLISILLIIGFLVLPKFSSNTIDRFRSLSSINYDITSMDEEYHLKDDGKPSNWNGVTIRLAIWKCASQIIIDNWAFGVGTGDYKVELRKYYQENGFNYGIKKDYNTHNHYIYVLVCFGFVGLMVFLVLQFIVLAKWIKLKDKRFLFLQLIFLICFITENLLNRNQGVFSYSFFSALFIQLNHTKFKE